MAQQNSFRFLLVLSAAALLAGCTAPKEPLGATVATQAPEPPVGAEPGSPAGGGRVLNAPPRVLDFAGSLRRADNGGDSVEVFRATLSDDNAEGDLGSLTLVGDGPQRFQLTKALVPENLGARESAPGGDGWAVWDAAPHDGLLQVSARFTYPYGAAEGEYVWTLTVRDAQGMAARSGEDLTLVEPVHVVEVEGAVTADGRLAPAEGWGGWSAAPGARDVPSVTYLKVRNQGTAAGQRFLVDFTTRDFVGAEDRTWRVPLDGNVRFAAWEALPTQAPREGSFRFGEVSPDGSLTLQFTKPGAVFYVAYQVVQVPAPLPSQTYYASATVTAL